VRRGLLRTAELSRELEPVAQLLEATHIFTPTGLSLDHVQESAQDLYETINKDLSLLQRSGLSEVEISRLLHIDIQRYFQRFADEVSLDKAGTAARLVDERIAVVSRDIVQYAEQQLARVFPEKLWLVLAMHLTSTLEHMTQGRQMAEPAIQSVRFTYPIEYEVGRIALMKFRSALGVSLPESETDVLAVLLANADALLSSQQAAVGIVVAAHGRGIAAGLAELVNTLVGGRAVRWVELSLEQTPEELLGQVAHWVRAADQGSGVLLLVDFASLLSLGEMMTRQVGVQVRAISGVSAPLVVEAARRAQRSTHITLDQLATSLTAFRPLDASAKTNAPLSLRREAGGAGEDGRLAALSPRVILSVCLTGFGSAAKIAELIEERLPGLRPSGVEIICMDITLSGKTQDDIQRLVGNREVVAIVGTINPHLEQYPYIALTDFLFGDGIARLRTLLGETWIDPAVLHPSLIDDSALAAPLASFLDGDGSLYGMTPRSQLVQQITQTLNQRMLFLNPVRAIPLIDKMIELIEVEVGETFDIEVLAGLMLHLACILERGIQHTGLLVSDAVRTLVEQQFPRDLSVCREALQVLSAQVARPLPDEEAYNIVGILRQVDIFIANSVE